MAQTSHTLGEWLSREGNSSGMEVVGKKPRGGDYIIARCGGKDREANARLIAAAPDLLEAVQSLRTAILMNGEWDDGCFYHNQRTASELQRPLELARAAIAKAEGSTNA